MTANLVLERSVSYWLKKQKVPQSLWDIMCPYFNAKNTVVDLGCAGGRVCKALKPYFKKTFAIDKDQNILNTVSDIEQGIKFICGDFGFESTWKKTNTKFDLIVSDCAIRKDYVDIFKLSDLCKKYLNPNGCVILRMQALQDMSNIFPAHIRRNLFYNEKEIESAFIDFDLKLNLDFFVQKFSSNKYLSDYLSMINIQDKPERSLVNLSRQYYVIEAKKK